MNPVFYTFLEFLGKKQNNSKLRNHPDLAVFSVKNHPSWKSKEVCTHSYIVSIRRKFKTFLSYHSSLIRSVYLPVAVFICANFYFDLRGLTCMYTLNWIAMAKPDILAYKKNILILLASLYLCGRHLTP